MFSFNAYQDEERGVEGSRILTVTSLFNTKITASNLWIIFEMTKI